MPLRSHGLANCAQLRLLACGDRHVKGKHDSPLGCSVRVLLAKPWSGNSCPSGADGSQQQIGERHSQWCISIAQSERVRHRPDLWRCSVCGAAIWACQASESGLLQASLCTKGGFRPYAFF